MKFDVLCLGILINNCNATSVRPSKWIKEFIQCGSQPNLQGNLRPHCDHANRLFRNAIEDLQKSKVTSCLRVMLEQIGMVKHWETTGKESFIR